MNHTRAEVLVLGAKTEPIRWRKPALSEPSFRKILSIAGAFVLVLLLAIFFSLIIASSPAIRSFRIRFLFSATWDPVKSEFGAFPLSWVLLPLPSSPSASRSSSPYPSPSFWGFIGSLEQYRQTQQGRPY
jgi:hypothetical protein